jgi:hypothetical protein
MRGKCMQLFRRHIEPQQQNHGWIAAWDITPQQHMPSSSRTLLVSPLTPCTLTAVLLLRSARSVNLCGVK